MDYFITIKKNLAKCLFYPNQTRLFDTKRLMATFAGFRAVVSLFMFLTGEADDVTDYAFSAYCTLLTQFSSWYRWYTVCGHRVWYFSHVKLDKDLAMRTEKSMMSSLNWIGIYSQWMYNEYYQLLWRQPKRNGRSSVLEVRDATETHLIGLVLLDNEHKSQLINFAGQQKRILVFYETSKILQLKNCWQIQ